MTHLRDYHRALETITTAPLTLTEADFAVLEEYGGPQDERRGREAQRQAQLALVPQAPPLQTKAADRPPARPRWLDPATLGLTVGGAIRTVVEPLRDRVTALEGTIAALKDRVEALEQRVEQLRADHQALAEVVLSDLELVAPRPDEPSLDPGPARPSRRTH